MRKETKTKDCFHRSAAVLLALLFTTLSAHAQLTCIASPSDEYGTVKAEETLVYVKPAAGYYIFAVTYNGMGTNIALQETGMPANSPYPAGTVCYLAPSTEGTVTAIFATKTNKVRVSFNMNGYGTQVPDQELQLGQTVARPDSESGIEGVTFLGWSTSKSGTPITYYDFSTVLSKSLVYSLADGYYTLTLYARWDVKGGSCGTGVNWLVSKSEGSSDYDVLTISGNGTIDEKSSRGLYPWYAYRASIKEVVIGDGVKNIPAKAFDNYNQLTDVTIGNSVDTIGDYAFYKTSLTSLVISNSVKTIGDYAFSETGLTSLTIGNSVETISKRAFYKTSLTSLVISNSVKTIGDYAFSETGLTSLTIGNSVETISNRAFYRTNLESITFGNSVETIGDGAFCQCWSSAKFDILLPASLKVIEKNAFCAFPGDHACITVPNGATLTVNGKDYSGEIKDGKADLISYLFKNLKYRTSTPKVTTAVMAAPDTYTITTDGKCEAYYNGGTKITTARAGETVILSWDGETVPTGQYVSGFSINDGAVEVVPNEDNTDYYFIMPASNVSVTTLTSPREEYTLDLTEEEQVAIPETMFTLLNTLMGYYGGDAESMWLDINLDGTPDLQIKRPVEEDEEADSDDEFPNEYSVKRLAGADALPKNYRFTPVYPFPYRYNSILVKLGEDREVQQQMRIDEELTDTDPYDSNQSLITMHAESTEEGPINVLISGRTLYKDGYWNTLCLPFDINDFNGTPLDGATVMELDTEGTYGGHQTGLEGGTLYLNFKTVNSIEAGKPYIVKWVTPASDLKNPMFYGVSITEAVPTDVTFNGGKFCGTYAPTGIYNDEHTKYYLGAENKLYYPSAVGYKIKSFRAYFDFGADEQFAGIRAFTLNFDEGETTNIIATEDVESRMRDGVWYTLDGRRQSGKPTARGIYVNNGRKVVIK